MINTVMIAPEHGANDVPDRPYFVSQPAQEEEDEDEKEKPIVYTTVKRAEPVVKAAERPIVPRTPITPAYRPAFVPPKPVAPTQKPERTPKIELDQINTGTVVIHKAFGEGKMIFPARRRRAENEKPQGACVFVQTVCPILHCRLIQSYPIINILIVPLCVFLLSV